MGTLGRRWSTLDLNEAYRLYVGGMSFSQVAAVLGCTKSYVARRFREAKLQARPSGRPFTTAPPVVDPADIVRLRNAGCSFPRIAAELGLSADSARDRYLLAVGRPRRAGRRRSSASAPNIKGQHATRSARREGAPRDAAVGVAAEQQPSVTRADTSPAASPSEVIQ